MVAEVQWQHLYNEPSYSEHTPIGNGGGGTDFLTPYATPYNELSLYNEHTLIKNGGGGAEWP